MAEDLDKICILTLKKGKFRIGTLYLERQKIFARLLFIPKTENIICIFILQVPITMFKTLKNFMGKSRQTCATRL